VLIEHILHTKGTEVATVTPDLRVGDAVALLRDRNVGALVVTAVDDETRVAGIISERDIVRALGGDETSAADVVRAPVSSFMTETVATCTPGDSVDDVMRLMTDRRVRHIPVVDDDRLAGIVSIGDVVKSRIDELETETSTLHEYLSSGR
jgi:CBS domain-containing protein